MDQLKFTLDNYSLFDISLYHYLLALFCLAGGWVLRQISMAVLRHVVKLSAKTETAVDDILIDAISKPLSAMCFVLGAWAALEVLPIQTDHVTFARILHGTVKAITVLIVIWFALRLVDRSTRHMQERAVETKSPILDVVPVFRKTAKVFLVLIGILIVVQDMGYSVGSLIAGLGLGGLAIGLAAKDTLANFFGSVVIFVDRPFGRGDWIKIGDHEGIVEEIGVRVTRIRTFQDSLITIPNAQLTTTAIINWSAMRKRRIKFTVELTRDSDPARIESATAAIRKHILSDQRYYPDGFTVTLNEVGAYSLGLLIVCFTITTDYQEFVRAQQDLLLATLRIVRESQLELAVPAQNLNVPRDVVSIAVQPRGNS